MKEVKLIGGVKSDKQTPLRRRRDLCRVPAGYITSHQNIFLTDDKNTHPMFLDKAYQAVAVDMTLT
jgi:hypothetical protein